ncbi:unnamed protein product [Brachionus calyciflorus]|uniref:Signal recognition particle subunit SRP72 n=1 Tax=Brachionus calyciflorus TaxID=104777 RepID=A0A813SU33_9BILA|nr:unnamed protein product [Brachionus calyciflorus]
MSDKNADQIKALYTELHKIAPTQDWERILKIAKKILGLSVTEKKAFHCKTVCLIHLDKFDEALTGIERNPDAQDLYFEKAYCEYRLNRVQESYNTLIQCKNMTHKEKELLAQVTYKLEKFNESYDVYRDLVKNIDDEYDNERKTNFSAVVAALRTSDPSSTKDLDMSENENQTYELCYNSACIAISKGKYDEAEEKLKKAEVMCQETFEDEEDQEFVESEKAIIRIQLAFCLQKLGKIDDALKLYNNVTKNKPADLSVNAVASNNLVCINKDQNIFDSRKKLKAATSSDLDTKLNSMQRSVIAYNEILFSIITNQRDASQKLLEQYKTKFDNKEKYAMLKVVQLYKEKKFSECEKLLSELVKSGKASSVLKFYLIQVLLTQGKQSEAVEIFKSLDEYNTFKLGVVSAMVVLFKHLNDKTSITNLFSEAVNHFTKLNPNAKELEVYMRENSNYQTESGNLQKACEMLEKMRTFRPKDFRILSKLINLYSKFDGEKAKALSKELPSLEDVAADSDVDVDSLESNFSLLNSKFARSKTVASTGPKSPDQSKAGETSVKPKKKKKNRKVKLPKNYNPNIPLDPERWIPLRERSYYKGRRNKKRNQIGKGTQGAVSTKESAPAQPQSPKPGSTATPDMSAPKPKLPAGAQKKKKKSNNKW